MGVYIKGIEPPKYMECRVVLNYAEEKAYVHYRGMEAGRFDVYDIIPVPDHGDLIDRDELMKHGVYLPRDGGYLPLVYMSYVKGAKTVIPAERNEASLCDNCDQRNDKGCCVCKYIKERSEE